MTLRTLLMFLALLPAAGVLAIEAEKPAEPPDLKYDWGIAYYLSYDNNLGPAMPIIVKAIRSGVSANAIAAVQVDMPGPGGMQRVALIGGEDSKVIKLASDDSADENQAIAYFEWFVKTYPCKHYGFFFLDHGGDLDQMCADVNPDTKDKFFMSGRVLGEKLRAFKATLKSGNIDLLFFQQCGRGSLENLYSFRGIADCVLISPVNVGAPNTYYTPLHQWLGLHPDATGKDVAAKIAAEDKDYSVYTCINSAKIDDIPSKLDLALKPILEKPAPKLPARTPAVYAHSGTNESTVDLKAYLEALSAANGAATEAAAFQKWIDEELIVKRYIQKDHAELDKTHCGLAFFVPNNVDEAAKYSAMDLYKKSTLGALWKKLFPAKTAAALQK